MFRDKFKIAERPINRKKADYEKQAEILHILNKIYILKDVEKFLWASLSLYNISKRLQSPSLLSLASGDLGMALSGIGRPAASAHFISEAIRLSSQTPNPRTEAIALSRQGFSFLFNGRANDAAASFIKALSIFKVIGEKWEYLSAVGGLGQCYFETSDFHKAESTYKDLGDTALDAKNPLHLGWMFTKVTFCRYILGSLDADLASELILQGIVISEKCNDRMNVYRSYGHLASIAINEKDASLAADYAVKIWKMSKSYKVTMPHISMTLIYACEAALFAAEHGRFSSTKKNQLLNIARHSFKKLHYIAEKFEVLKGAAMLSEARYYAYCRNDDYTELYFSAALALLTDSKDRWLTAKAYQDAAMAIPYKQKEYLVTAHSLFSECKALPDCERVSKLILKDHIPSSGRS